MVTPETREAFERAAISLRAAAQSHKRAEAWHRSRSRETQAALVELRAQCARLGIELRIEAEAGVTHGQPEEQQRRARAG